MVRFMRFFLVPKYAFTLVTAISAAFLIQRGIKFLMLDLDNTLTTYGGRVLPQTVVNWAAEMKACGIVLYIVSNSRRPGRVERFSEELGIGFVKGANKPFSAGVKRAMRTAGFAKAESALVGDQIYTDTMAANFAGVTSIIVQPLSIKNPAFALRYALEVPLRAMCGNKMWRKQDEQY